MGNTIIHRKPERLYYTRLFFLFIALFFSGKSMAVNVVEFSLVNGMRVIIKEDHRFPIAISQIWYKVGSIDEYEGITGISHALEHMMFNGTKKVQAGQFSHMIAEKGGRDNAFTSNDFTAYYVILPKEHISLAFELEADRMIDLDMQQESFTQEMKVVAEERRLRTDDNPNSQVYESLFKNAFSKDYPLHHPVIGWMRDIEKMKLNDLKDWYKRWYSPNNAILVVVGDVNPAELKSTIEKNFVHVKKRKIEQRIRAKDTLAPGKFISVEANAEVPYLMLGYKIPSFRKLSYFHKWELYALEMLAQILDGGKSSRFYKNLIRGKRIAASTDASSSIFSYYPGLFVIDGTPREGFSTTELQAAIQIEIEKVQKYLVSEKELSLVKAQLVASEIYQRDSIKHQATLIGMLETNEIGWQMMDQYIRNLERVTAEQIRKVAQKYLTPANLTTVVLDI